ncbi:hypothetical protein [Microcoleus sp. Pol14C4]
MRAIMLQDVSVRFSHISRLSRFPLSNKSLALAPSPATIPPQCSIACNPW